MNISKMFAESPTVRKLREKQDFVGKGQIALGDWTRLEEASAWSEGRWERHKQKYRRHVRVEQETADFEFEHDDETVEFRLKFG